MYAAILVPARNEARTIGAVVRECLAVTKRVLVIDDGSADGTGALARSAGASVLRNRETRGLGFSLRRGLTHLRSKGASLVVTLDGDGVHDAGYVPTLLQVHKASRADLTIGTRFTTRADARSVPSSKIAANDFATRLINMVLDLRMTDVASGMRVIGPRVADLAFDVDNYGISFEFIARADAEGYRLTEAPIRVRYDASRPFVTNQGELINLLDYSLKKAHERRKRAGSLVELTRRVRRFETIAADFGKVRFLLHPIRPLDGYLFQRQLPWFREVLDRPGDLLVMDET